MKEEDIRPADIFEEYLRLTDQDARLYFSDVKKEQIACPACGLNGSHEFKKANFDYCRCSACETLYVNPRPVAEAFTEYYTKSASAEFWATTFYKNTAEARREKLWRPKAKELDSFIRQFYGSSQPAVIDIGGGYGIFADEMKSIGYKEILLIEPSPFLASVSRDKGHQVVEKFLEDVTKCELPQSAKVFVSFELFEHLHDPKEFLKSVARLMSDNDIFIFTTLSGVGADIQALWNDSKSVSPPHHLNFFNPWSIRLLAEKCELKIVEVTTPGKLDLDILLKNKDKIKDRFWRAFINNASIIERERAQNWLANHCLSSHMRVVLKK